LGWVNIADGIGALEKIIMVEGKIWRETKGRKTTETKIQDVRPVRVKWGGCSHIRKSIR